MVTKLITNLKIFFIIFKFFPFKLFD